MNWSNAFSSPSIGPCLALEREVILTPSLFTAQQMQKAPMDWAFPQAVPQSKCSSAAVKFCRQNLLSQMAKRSDSTTNATGSTCNIMATRNPLPLPAGLPEKRLPRMALWVWAKIKNRQIFKSVVGSFQPTAAELQIKVKLLISTAVSSAEATMHCSALARRSRIFPSKKAAVLRLRRRYQPGAQPRGI